MVTLEKAKANDDDGGGMGPKKVGRNHGHEYPNEKSNRLSSKENVNYAHKVVPIDTRM